MAFFEVVRPRRDDDGCDAHLAYHGKYTECMRLWRGAEALKLRVSCTYGAVGYGSVYVLAEGEFLGEAVVALAGAGLYDPDAPRFMRGTCEGKPCLEYDGYEVEGRAFAAAAERLGFKAATDDFPGGEGCVAVYDNVAAAEVALTKAGLFRAE